MGHPVTNVGAQITVKAGLAPIALSAGASNGGAINRTGFQSCKLVCSVGAATGSPTAQSVTTKLQHSATSGGTYADYTDPDTGAVAACAAVIADDSTAELNVNLKGAYNYIRTVETVAFTGGTTPAIVSAPMVILGGATVEPAVAP
jgi:hypothetical protein